MTKPESVQHTAPLFMVRRNLEGIPEFALPAGFSLRRHQPGDEENWFRIQAAADQYNPITPQLFQKELGTDEELLAGRQHYLLDSSGYPIGCAAAWFKDNFEGVRFGRVHWVAILPEYQGRGLSCPLMTAICHRLRELGHDRVYLTTAAVRLPAIRLYRRFGFVPLIRSEADEVLWRGVRV